MLKLLLNPLLLNVLLVSYLILLFQINVKLLDSLIYRSSSIYQYKINNMYLSLMFISSYVIVVIILLYILRVYNLPRSVDLKEIHEWITTMQNLYTNYLGQYSILGKTYVILFLSLLGILSILGVIKIHKFAYKEIHKIFLYISAHPNVRGTNIFNRILDYSCSIHISTDIVRYVAIICARYIQTFLYGKNYNYAQLPYYNLYKFLCVCNIKGYYNFIVIISPMFFIIYDCIFNNYIITHVFYYLLFYIPLRLFKRIIDGISTNGIYITRMLFEILYNKEEDCLYAASPTLKAILDNYVLSGLVENFDLGVQSQGELILSALTRFVLSDKLGPLDEIYVNEDSQFLHTNDRIHYYHVIPDENEEPMHGVEWIIIADKTKHRKE